MLVDSNAHSEANHRAFQTRRAVIEHEDRQIESRLASLLVANSFLVTAVVILFANAYNGRDPVAFYGMALLISVVSVLLAVLTEYGILGSRLAQAQARMRGGPFDRIAPFVGPDAEDWRACVHLDNQSEFKGSYIAAHWFSKATVLAWSGITHFSLKQLFGLTVAWIGTILAFVLVYIVLVWMYLRFKPRETQTPPVA